MRLISPDPSKLTPLKRVEYDDPKKQKKADRYWEKNYQEAEKLLQKSGSPVSIGKLGRENPTGGRHIAVVKPVSVLGTSPNIAGLNPFLITSGAPKIGVPIGNHLHTNELVGLCPHEYLMNGYVSNPGIIVMAQPGVGKSALVKRLIMGMSAFGHRPLILGDVKPDYPDVIELLGGQVIKLGAGLDQINPLDTGAIYQAIERLNVAGKQEEAKKLQEKSQADRVSFVKSVCAIFRGEPLSENEQNIIAAAIYTFDSHKETEPTLADLYNLLLHPSEKIMEAALHFDYSDNLIRYKETVLPLLSTLLGLTSSYGLGGLFSGKTTTPIDLDAPALQIDISSIPKESEDGKKTLSAAMLAVWTYSMGAVKGSLALSEAGLEPPRRYVSVMDELWLALRGSPALVDNIDMVIRTNRSLGMSNIMVTHSVKDFAAIKDPAARSAAASMIQNTAVKIIGAVPSEELDHLGPIIGGLSLKEKTMISSWSGGSNFNLNAVHPGQGKFHLRVGDESGFPFKLTLTEQEKVLYETTI